jgi:hypothetical protein
VFKLPDHVRGNVAEIRERAGIGYLVVDKVTIPLVDWRAIRDHVRKFGFLEIKRGLALHPFRFMGYQLAVKDGAYYVLLLIEKI